MEAKIKMVLISNIMFEPYLRTYISKAFSATAVAVQWIYVPHDEISEKQNVLRSADMITLCLNFDVLYPDVLNDVAQKKSNLIRLSGMLFTDVKIFTY